MRAIASRQPRRATRTEEDADDWWKTCQHWDLHERAGGAGGPYKLSHVDRKREKRGGGVVLVEVMV